MKIKYYCCECQNEDLFEECEIAYKYELNINGKHTVWNYVCKKCSPNLKSKESQDAM